MPNLPIFISKFLIIGQFRKIDFYNQIFGTPSFWDKWENKLKPRFGERPRLKIPERAKKKKSQSSGPPTSGFFLPCHTASVHPPLQGWQSCWSLPQIMSKAQKCSFVLKSNTEKKEIKNHISVWASLLLPFIHLFGHHLLNLWMIHVLSQKSPWVKKNKLIWFHVNKFPLLLMMLLFAF